MLPVQLSGKARTGGGVGGVVEFEAHLVSGIDVRFDY